MYTSLTSLLQEQIRDIYNAENQLVKALPKMGKKASSESLRTAFEGHLAETQGQVERLAEVARILEMKPGGKVCKAMQGLVEEGKEVLNADGKSSVVDAALIAVAQRVEHYEIAAYTGAVAMAEQLGATKVVKLLQESLDEELASSEKLSDIATGEVHPAMNHLDDSDEEMAVAAPRKTTRSVR